MCLLQFYQQKKKIKIKNRVFREKQKQNRILFCPALQCGELPPVLPSPAVCLTYIDDALEVLQTVRDVFLEVVCLNSHGDAGAVHRQVQLTKLLSGQGHCGLHISFRCHLGNGSTLKDSTVQLVQRDRLPLVSVYRDTVCRRQLQNDMDLKEAVDVSCHKNNRDRCGDHSGSPCKKTQRCTQDD